MEEAYLKSAFDIKTTCDAISRRLLRWHWEKKKQKRTLRDLMSHVELRTAQNPTYYGNMPHYDSTPNWQMFDTTFCMRVLLDGEAEVIGTPLHLLQYANDEGKARRACNGLRIARNHAAHAVDKAGAAKAAQVFAQTIVDLFGAYDSLVFSKTEFNDYEKLAKKALRATGVNAKSSVAQPDQKRSSTKGSKVSATRRTTGGTAKASQKQTSAQGARRASTTNTRSKRQAQESSQGAQPISRESLFFALAIVVFTSAILVRVLVG